MADCVVEPVRGHVKQIPRVKIKRDFLFWILIRYIQWVGIQKRFIFYGKKRFSTIRNVPRFIPIQMEDEPRNNMCMFRKGTTFST